MKLDKMSAGTTSFLRMSLSLGFCLSLGVANVQPAPESQGAPQSFEVASIRRNISDRFTLGGVRILPGGSVVASNVSLRALIGFAYRIDVYESIEGRADLLDQNFDVRAQAGTELARAPSGEYGAVHLMMQNLLAERFKLVVRVESRIQPGYALVKGDTDGTPGPGIRPSDLDCSTEAMARLKAAGESRSCAVKVIGYSLSTDGGGMVNIARAFSSLLRRPVLDETGLKGSFQLRMTFDTISLAQMAGVPVVQPVEGADVPSLFTAVQEQLGLKLEPRRVPVRVLIVDSVGPLSEN